MNSKRKNSAHIVSTHSSMNQHLMFIGFLLLAALVFMASTKSTYASTSQILTPLSQQEISVRSFHETTELAENLWAELTNSFVEQYEKGDYQTAFDIAQRTYDIANKNFGLNDVNTADALLKLGIISQTLGKLNEAEDHLLGALVILEEKLSPDHPDVAVVMTNLGNVYFELRQPEESEKYHQQALQIRKNAFGEENPSVAQSTYNLAILYESQKQYEKAANFYLQSINTWSASLGPTHPYVGNALSNLGNIYNIQGQHKKATNVLQRTVAFKKSVFGAQHEEVAQTLINLGTNYLEQGKYRPASNAYEEALDIAQNILRSSDPQLALLMYTLANIYHTQARIEEKEFVDISTPENAQFEEDEATIVSHTSTEENVDRKKESLFQQALPLYQKAAEILDDGESGKQSALDVILTELAMLYKEIGDTDMALATESRIAAH